MLFHLKENDILSNLTTDEYSLMIQLLEEAILSTDLFLYLKSVEFCVMKQPIGLDLHHL